MHSFKEDIDLFFKAQGVDPKHATLKQRYAAVSHAAMQSLPKNWAYASKKRKRVGYYSAEFLIGRVIHANLYNLGLLQDADEFLQEAGFSINDFEQIDDAAFGNGGLGRLAACFLDSAATHDIPLDGYGIRYQFGLFKQSFQNGLQQEMVDDWEHYGDPWSVRVDDEAVEIHFKDQVINAVPYDMPVIGYGGKTINKLRLWKSETQHPFDFAAFNNGEYDKAVGAKTRANEICAVLYPNDNTHAGKVLRLKQQYFFSSASLQCMVRRFVGVHGTDFAKFPEMYAIQLNDTHPVVAIPELLRILMGEHGLSIEDAFAIAQKTFAYTNHTLMEEALEQWDVSLFCDVIPEVYAYVEMIQKRLEQEMKDNLAPFTIVRDGRINMARLAVYATFATNGVSELHGALLKSDLFKHWHEKYPERLNSKTNGITQRRWLGLCNPEFAAFLTERVGDGWLTDLNQLEKLIPLAEDSATLDTFAKVKRERKAELAKYIKQREGIDINPDSMIYSLCKRIHEYKRQLLDAFALLDMYYRVKAGEISITPSTFIFGGKAAPGYDRAKGIIKFINEIAAKVNNDPDTRDVMKIVFVQNYNVSYAEKIMPATDVSVQISTVGTEASGTGNMKMMLNGAVTLGTLDGANIEIVEKAGLENNYIFGKNNEDFQKAKETYNARTAYEANPRLKRVVDGLVDGAFDDGGTGAFKELHTSLLDGAHWHEPDHYFLLMDFADYADAKLRVNQDYQKRYPFLRKQLLNTANAGFFSSDNTILKYAQEIWGVDK